MQLIKRSNFKDSHFAHKTDLYTLKNSNGLTAQITNYGATLVSLWVRDKGGQYRDVVLGYKKLEDYLEMTNPYFGKTIGRYANRIAYAHFSMNGQDYFLQKNNGDHNLHSGTYGCHSVVWALEERTLNSLTLSHTSLDLASGFPGNVKIQVCYKITETNALDIVYEATTDADTHVNLTHHSYFNLESSGKNTIEDHVLQIKAKAYMPVTQECIPLKDLKNVAGTPFDFYTPKKIGSRIDASHPQIQRVQGYDHNYILDGTGYREVAKVFNQSSGIHMIVYTDEPGLQFYTGNDIVSHPLGKYDIQYVKRSGFCLESQHHPDSPNRSDVPSTLLKKGELYSSRCTYQFTSKG